MFSINLLIILIYSSPVTDNKALIALSAAAVQAEFEIGEDTITMVKFACGSKTITDGINAVMNKPMILKDLIKAMRRQGVDIFADYDSHCYIEGNMPYFVFHIHYVPSLQNSCMW